MSGIDLHIHSTASDGTLSPEAVVSRAAELGLKVIALADHDTVEGIAPALEAARRFPNLTVIPCVEMSTDIPSGEAHILGYFIDYTDANLLASLERFRGSRVRRARGMVTRLADLGVNIDWQRVQEIAGDASIGRPHIAQAMLEKGYISSIKEAFDRYIGREGPAYVEREKMTPEQVVALILRSRGLPVLAHPLTLKEPEAMVIRLKAAGMVGLETYYDSFTPEQVRYLASLAERYGLIATGGSDYHGLPGGDETMMGAVDVPSSAVEKLTALAAQRAAETP